MCGRYYIDDDSKEFKRIFSLLKDECGSAKGEVRPSETVPVVCTGGAVKLMKWGFKRSGGNGLIINARSETAADRPMFADAVRHRRCLVPANSYFEWSRQDKRKYCINIGSGAFYMGGLYKAQDDGNAFVILTCCATGSVGIIHERMPVIFGHDDALSWLRGDDPKTLFKCARNDVCFTQI